jgi:outer membrane immunogenic protein
MSGDRKRRALLVGVVALTAAASGAAHAADLSAQAPVYTKAPLAGPVYDWTGCYVGVHAGAGTQSDSFTLMNGVGGLAGGQAGCNVQLGQMVLGAEGEGAWTDLLDQNEAFSTVSSARNRWTADAALRAGVAVDRALVYGKVGASWGGFDFSSTFSGVLPSTEHATGTLTGLLLGGGIEYAFAPHWTARLEYDHVDYVGRVLDFGVTEAGFPPGIAMQTTLAATNVVKAGVNYNFGDGSARFGDASVASIGRAAAAPLYTKAPSGSPVYDWTGCYIGIHGGGGTGNDAFTGVNSISGLAGGQAGCNKQLGQIVLGIEGEGAWTNLNDDNTRNVGAPSPQQLATANRWSADAAVRTGVAVDRALVYGKAGVAWGRFDSAYGFAFDGTVENASSTLTGLLLGGGIEYAFAPHWTAKLEFDHIDYVGAPVVFNATSFVNPVSFVPSASVFSFVQTQSASVNVVKAGVNYQFDGQNVRLDPPRPSLPAAAHDWTGCYAGIHAGGGTQNDSQTVEGAIFSVNFFPGVLSGINGAGGLAGAQAGCNDQFGQVVLGVEGEGAWANLRDKYVQDTPVGDVAAGAHEHWNADAALRAGIAVDRALVYGKVGASWGGFDASATISDPFVTVLDTGSGTLAGLLLGGGIEYAFAPHWSAKLEFDHVDYASRELQFNQTLPPPPVSFGQSFSASNNVVKVGVNYQFGDWSFASTE